MRRVSLYSDAACNPNPGHCGWAVKLYDEESHVSKGFAGAIRYTSAPRAKMLSIIYGLQALKYPCHVTVFTDVSYLKSMFDRLKSGRAYGNEKHSDLWKSILEQKHELEFHTFTRKDISDCSREVKNHANLLANAEALDTDEVDEFFQALCNG